MITNLIITGFTRLIAICTHYHTVDASITAGADIGTVTAQATLGTPANTIGTLHAQTAILAYFRTLITALITVFADLYTIFAAHTARTDHYTISAEITVFTPA